ncbi:MAG: hypothetical protein PWQ18_199 [Clostridia bacterium]|nr:hypothetical protein [Clostridia bacterium]
MNSYQAALKAINFAETVPVPVVLWVVGQTYAPFAGIPDNEYYADPDKMLNAQMRFYERFPDVFTVPGLWPDLGTIPELGALGAQIEFPATAPPQVRRPALQDIKDVEKLHLPDPRRADYTSQVLDYLRYFVKNVPAEPRQKHGFLEGHLFCGGPGEIAALMLGYDKISFAMFDYPELVHQLLRQVTDFIKSYLAAQMEVVGPAKRLCLWDHFPGMLSHQMYAEFVHPYLREVFAFVGDAEIKVYHNENNYPHLMALVREVPANVVHVGAAHDLVATKKAMGKCVMGNIHPIQELIQAPVEDLRQKCREIIRTAGPGGGLWLSTAGGMAPETTSERMEILVEVAQEMARR